VVLRAGASTGLSFDLKTNAWQTPQAENPVSKCALNDVSHTFLLQESGTPLLYKTSL
jgi:hypothetical protein